MNKNVAKIKIAQKQLGMADDTYRALLNRLTGKTSAAALSVTEQYKVLAEMERLGFKPSKPHASKGLQKPASRKLLMLWRDLYQSGHVQNQSTGALAAWVKSQTDKDHIDWLTPKEASRLIETLKTWLKRPVKEANHEPS